ncbi:MAG: TRAP transporter fused permease subunit, partial [Nitrospinota bacterium]
PGILGHPGVSIPRIMEYLFITQSGMLGMVVEVFANYVLLFVILGAFLERSGLGALFFDLAYALTGHRTGGPGMTAVVSSAIYGMISGSGVANVVTTGTFTIPLMKRVGYRPHFAGAVEAAASSGGQYMPPVMGAGAFLLAEAAEVSYLEVVKIAFVPAVLYFLSVGLIVYFEAVKQGLHGVPREELPPLRKVLPRCYQLFPIVVVAYLLLAGRSAFYAAFWAIVWTVALSWLQKDTRMGPREIFDALVGGAHNSLSIGALAGVLGIIIGSLILSGIQDRFASLLIQVSGGSLVITILLVIFAGYIFGMGVPVTAAYVMTAIVGVGALVRLGVPPLSAHLLCFWVAVVGGVTPPVALCAYAGASIAGADPLRTGFTATKLASWIFIMPFLFVYTPILFTGPPLEVVRSMLTAAVAACAWAGALEGYLFRETKLYERILLLVAALGLLHTSLWTDLVGVAAFAFVAITQRRGVSAAAA